MSHHATKMGFSMALLNIIIINHMNVSSLKSKLRTVEYNKKLEVVNFHT